MQEGMIIGYDISDTSCQISFYNNELGEPETFEASPESFQIPMVIGKRNNTWAIGIDAKRLEILHEGKLTNELIRRSIAREKVILENKSYDAIMLLSRFVKMSLDRFENIAAIVFTVPILNEDIALVLKGVASHMGISKENIYVQDYRESFCNYMLNQPKELWQYEAALFYCDKKQVRACMLRRIESEKMYNTVFITVDDIAFASQEELDIIYPILHGEKAVEADARFKLFVEHVFDQRMVSSVYLTGEGFDNHWYPNSLKVLCNGRRAFMGNNLYSKGACYSAYQRYTHTSEDYVYIDENKLTESVTMKIRDGNEEHWFPLISWGTHPYECDKQFEILLEDTEDIELHVESLYKGKMAVHQVSLEGVPERESYSLRLLVDIMSIDSYSYRIAFKDIGFGEFFQSTDYETELTIELGGIYGEHNSLS
ncbi:MAG: DUF5716 family protein [Eubacteriales bacterium]